MLTLVAFVCCFCFCQVARHVWQRRWLLKKESIPDLDMLQKYTFGNQPPALIEATVQWVLQSFLKDYQHKRLSIQEGIGQLVLNRAGYSENLGDS